MWIRCFPLWRENAKPWHRTYVYLCKSAADIPSKLFLYKYEITFPMFWPGFHKWHFVRGQEKTAVCIFVWWEGVQKVFGKSKKSQRCSVIHQQTHSVLNVIFFPQISFFFFNENSRSTFCVSDLQVRCPEEVTPDRKAAHNALDQRDMTPKRLLERRSVKPPAQKEYYNLIMESDLDHNRIYGCLENGFGSDVCSEAAKRWPMIMATEAKHPLTAHVLTVFSTFWIK